MIKIAFAGFRHGHILSLYRLAQEWNELTVVAACEEHAETKQRLSADGSAAITHNQVDTMLDQTECDVVAIGDYFARRGDLAIKALERGCHVIADKPLCTDLDQLARIEELTNRTGLKVGCMLGMRDSPPMLGLRQLVAAGTLGEIHGISFGGQHPLLLGSRPQWYFEAGKHGGTITDIAIHAIDALPWITGLEFSRIEAARCWNAFAPQYPHFEDAAQMMLTMDNGCGVLGDVSYFAPDGAGYKLPFYWRTTLWGRKGVAETSTTAKAIDLALAEDSALQHLPLPAGQSAGYLHSFIRDIQERSEPGHLNTAQVLKSTRTAINIQRAADTNTYPISLD